MSEQWAEMRADSNIDSHQNSESDAVLADSLNRDQLQLVDLSALKIYEVTGDDAAAFLQGQFCNDLNPVSPTHAQITGYCTPKGRLLVLPGIVGFAQGYRLLVPGDVAEGFIKRLKMFIMRSKVSVIERDDWIATGIVSTQTANLDAVSDLLGALPMGVMDVATSDTCQVIRWHDSYLPDIRAKADQAGSVTPLHESALENEGSARFLVLASVPYQLALWNSCNSAMRLSQARWRLADVFAGVPSLSADIAEAFVPQMLNLQLINALSFTKGCYPGQEIVARMQYLGKLKRHMRLYVLALSENRSEPGSTLQPVVVKAGDKLVSETDQDAGIVVDAVRVGDEYIALLAVVKVSANTTPLCVAQQSLLAMQLPYALPSLDAPSSSSSADAG